MYTYVYIHIISYDIGSTGSDPAGTCRCPEGTGWYNTPSLHNNIPAYNIFARGWVAQ